jgi:selenophosphate synthase
LKSTKGGWSFFGEPVDAFANPFHAGYAEMIATTTLLNRVGAELAKDPAIHAITDVTGFGLLGYALEVARNSGLTIVIQASDGPSKVM